MVEQCWREDGALTNSLMEDNHLRFCLVVAVVPLDIDAEPSDRVRFLGESSTLRNQSASCP